MVKIGSQFSQQHISTSGVPQDIHISTILFAIFINDLPMFIKCLLFADELKIFQVMLLKKIVLIIKIAGCE